jgi:hypothetical protein
LLVAGNNFTSTACISMCVGMAENLAMKSVSMNDNPIGEAGAKMIMQTSMTLGSRIQLSAASCNTVAQDPRCWYDPSAPCRDYVLVLSEPFHRAVAFHLMQIVATHSTLIFSECTYELPGRKADKLKLVQALSKDREQYFDEEQQNIIKGLRLLAAAASSTELGTKLFYEADADNSGRLDKDELQDVLDKIGFSIDPDRLLDMLAVFDVDGAGTIDLTEFQSLLKSQHHEAVSRIREMTQYPILCASTSPGVKYVPPRVGTLRCKVVDGFTRKKNFYTISSIDQKYAFQMAKGIGDVLMMTEAMRNSKLRINEAYSMFKMMYKETGDIAEVLVKVLPQMMHPHEARQLVSKTTHDERVQLARLKAAFSIATRPMFGAYNGYYSLDLSKDVHRTAFARLLEQSQTVNAVRASASIIGYGRVGDCSQHRNWSAFRNEYYNGEAVTITPTMFTPMPHSGLLEFDFSGGNRPVGTELRMSDRRLCKVLINVCLLEPQNTTDAMKQLDKWTQLSRVKSKDGKLFMPMYQMNVEKALEAGRASDDFYDNLPDRKELLRIGAMKEEVKINFMSMSQKETGDFGAEMAKLSRRKRGDSSITEGTEGEENSDAESADYSQSEYDGDSAGGGTRSGTTTAGTTRPGTADTSDSFGMPVLRGDQRGGGAHLSSIAYRDEDGSGGGGGGDDFLAGGGGDREGEEGGEDESLPPPESNQQLLQRKMRIKETKQRMKMLLATKKGVSRHAKASRFVEVVDEAFQQLWIMSRHLALIVKLFQNLFGDIGRTEFFGSYCTELVVLLFSRVIDLHNFELVLEVLCARDVACVLARVGILNIFNPLKPEVTMELDLRRQEERQVAKMIVYLSVDEPGINLTYKRFQWKREIDPIPGWDVTEPWFTEEGLPDHGKFAFTYYSGEGRNRSGCIPNLKLRKALTHLTLIDENEIIDESEMLPDELMCTAEEHFEQNRHVWSEYLLPGCDR